MAEGKAGDFESRALDWLGRHWKLVTFLCWLGFCGWMVFDRWTQIRWFALPDTDDNMRIMQVRALLDGAFDVLSDRDREVLRLRFAEDMTQTEIADRIGVSQMQVSRLLDVRGPRRVAAAQLTIDESTAVGVAQPEAAAGRLGFWATGIGGYVLWNAMTLVGALVGDTIGDPQRYGLDAAAAAAGAHQPRWQS